MPGRRVALLCAQVPPEVVVACGLEPWALTGREDAPPDPALPQNLCPLVRRAATLLAPSSPDAPAGAVLADSCYPLLRLHDHLAAAGGGVLLVRVPRGRDAAAARFFRDELQRLARALAALGGRYPDDAALAAAAAAAAQRRRARSACLAAALGGSAPALTPGTLRALEADAPLPPAAPAGAAPAPDGRPRLLLAGSCFVSEGLLRLLDALGVAVAAVDACGYARHSPEADAPPGGDPWAALAAAWLARPPCPRGEDAGRRADEAAELAARGAIDAVLYLRTANCTPQAYDAAHWRRRLVAAGVPFCAIEVDGPGWEQPRLTTRIEAFAESLAGRGRAAAPAR